MLASIERRITRLEARCPRVMAPPVLLDRRAPVTWLPRGISVLTEKQTEVFTSPARFRVVVAGRRGGKSALAVAELTRAARRGRERVCWYIAPSYRQAKQIVWEALKSAVPPRHIARKSEVDLSLTLRSYGSTITLRSADNPDSLRGAGLDLAILDEAASISPETWSEVIRPALADRQGEAIFLGTPRGYNHFHDWYSLALTAQGWAAFRYTTAEGGLVPPEEIEMVRRTLDPRTFAQEFEADFSQSVNRVYLMFSREHNVWADVKDLGGELWIGQDFNVNPMASIIACKAGGELHVFDELALHNSNTQELAEVLKRKYPGRRITVYPDPSGKARKTSAVAGQTDLSILRQAGFTVIAPPVAPPVVDRINTVNALLCDATGRKRLFIHPRCTHLIRGLEQLPYREGTSVPDKSLNLDHHPDALGYLALMEFPIVAPLRLFDPAKVAAMFTGNVPPLEEDHGI